MGTTNSGTALFSRNIYHSNDGLKSEIFHISHILNNIQISVILSWCCPRPPHAEYCHNLSWHLYFLYYTLFFFGFNLSFQTNNTTMVTAWVTGLMKSVDQADISDNECKGL